MNLAQLQREFRSALTQESTGATARFGNQGRAGLAVYRNNYRVALANCLSDNFATVRAWLGDEAFDRAVRIHIDQRPPHSWTLDAYTHEFPETLDLLYSQDPEVGELARLERDLGMAFVGADAEPLEISELPQMDWERAVLPLVPTLSLLSLRTNAAAIWSSIQSQATPPAASRLAEPLVLALWRKGFTVSFRALASLEAAAISMASEGRTFADICAAIAAEVGEEKGVQIAGNLLGQWVRDGMIARQP